MIRAGAAFVIRERGAPRRMLFRGMSLTAGLLACLASFAAPARAADAPAPLAKEAVDFFEARKLPFLIAVSIVTLILIFAPSVVLFVPDLIFGADLR